MQGFCFLLLRKGPSTFAKVANATMGSGRPQLL